MLLLAKIKKKWRLYLQCLFSAHTFSYHYFISRPIFSLPSPFLIVLHPTRKNVSSHSFHYEFSLRPASRSLKGLLSLSLSPLFCPFSTFSVFFLSFAINKTKGTAQARFRIAGINSKLSTIEEKNATFVGQISYWSRGIFMAITSQ